MSAGGTARYHSKVIADYDPDINYEPEESDPDIKAVNEEEENSEAEFAKIDLPQIRTVHQMSMNHKISERIKVVHQA